MFLDSDAGIVISMVDGKKRRNRRTTEHSRTSSPNNGLKVLPLEALDQNSADYVRILEQQYLLCTKEVRAYMDAINATREEAKKNLDKAAVYLSIKLGTKVSVDLTGIEQYERNADKFLDVTITIANADETAIRHVCAEIYESTEAYVERNRTLNMEVQPFIERADAFYQRLLAITTVERVTPDGSPRPYARAHIHSHETSLESIIDSEKGTVLATEDLVSRAAENSDTQSGEHEIACPVDASLCELYIVKNPSRVIGVEDLLFIAVSEISRRYHEEQAR
ncbi:hypothetical protein HY772_03165 [Candidatus Woesearchaeota archaeon]|nr:hypothetical protein [Candidatus Woesearchaeota archaeon]